MARSIRFFPPLSLTQPPQESVQESVTPIGKIDSSWKIKPAPEAKLTQEPPIDPSEHAAALVNEAVRKPTVLPPTYAIQENIGDRISRLASRKPVAKPVATLINPFKIPPPIPGHNGTSERAIAPEAIEDDINQPVNNVQLDTSASEVAETPPVMEAPESQAIEADIEQPVEEVEASVPTASVPEAPTVEQIPEPQATEADIKKQTDATQSDASASATVTTEAPTVAETPKEEVGEGIVESSEAEEAAKGETTTEVAESVAVVETANDEKAAITVEETTAEEAAVGVITEPIAAQETADNEAAAVVAERVVVEETPDDISDTNTPPEVVSKSDAVADPTPSQLTDSEATPVEASEAPSLLERVASVVETVVTAFTRPEADRKDAEAEKEPVSSNIEVVPAPPQDADVAQMSLDATVEPTPATQEKVTDTKTDEITCPACESTNLRKNGRRKGKQRYACKDCGKQFAAEAEDELNEEDKISSRVEASNANKSELEPKFSTSSKSSSKKKTKGKGFGNKQK